MSGTLAATTTAQSLGNEACTVALVQNDPANTADAYIGDSTAQPIRLAPGDAIEIPVMNVSEIYAKMVSGTGAIGWLPV